MAAKLTQFAQPRGWRPGDPVVGFERLGVPIAGHAYETPLEAYHLQADYHDGVLVDLYFTNASHRDQWLKWWSKP